MKKTILGILAVLTLAATAADAHPHLTMAGPAPNSTVKESPKAIRIQFNEGVEIAFTGVEITNEAGAKQQIGDASLNPKDNKQLIVPLMAALSPGKYTVTWHAVGDDTHHVEGKYNFTVKP